MVEWASGVLLCFLTRRRTGRNWSHGRTGIVCGHWYCVCVCVCVYVCVRVCVCMAPKDLNALCRQLFWCVHVCVPVCVCVCVYSMNVYVLCVSLQPLSHLIWSQIPCTPHLSGLRLIVAWPDRIKWACGVEAGEPLFTVPSTDKPGAGFPFWPLALNSIDWPFCILTDAHMNYLHRLLKQGFVWMCFLFPPRVLFFNL